MIDDGAARAKVEREGSCRRCSSQEGLEAVYTVSAKKQDRPWHENSATFWVNPDSVIPMCPGCKWAFENNEVGILLTLTPEEQINAVVAAGGILSAVSHVAAVGDRFGEKAKS